MGVLFLPSESVEFEEATMGEQISETSERGAVDCDGALGV
jgi:hypothetical protein